MKLVSFPLPMQNLCYTLRRANLELKEQTHTICALVEQIVAFLGKIALLEYAQGASKSPALNYALFQTSYPKTSPQWLHLTRLILNHFVQSGTTLTVYPLLNLQAKYPSLQHETERQDRIAKLLFFIGLAQQCDYLLDKPDLEEALAELWGFLEEFQFLDAGRYTQKQDQSGFIFGANTLWLNPFFKTHMGSEGIVLESSLNDQGALTTIFRTWLSAEFEKYWAEKQGILGFDAILQPYRMRYISLPWLQIVLEELVDKLTMTHGEMGGDNLLLIEGYPGSGKTALVANLAKLLPQANTMPYFITPSSPSQESETFHLWLLRGLCHFFDLSNKDLDVEILSAASHLLPAKLAAAATKIVVAVDGIENLSQLEYKKFKLLTTRPPLDRLLFIFCKRILEPPTIEPVYKLQLPWQDNIFFEQYLTPPYLQSLKNRYLTTPLAARVVVELGKSNKFLSAAEIAQRLQLFTPEVIPAITALKPLLEIQEEYERQEGCYTFPVAKYRLFNPAIRKMVG